MVAVCLPSDALLQHLPSYLGFSYLGLWVSLHGCSSKAQLLLLTLGKEYLLTASPSDLGRGIAPLGPPAPTQPPLLGHGIAPLGRRPGLGWGGNNSPKNILKLITVILKKFMLTSLFPYNSAALCKMIWKLNEKNDNNA